MPVPPKKTLVGLLALLTLAAYACGGDSCDDEAIAQEGLDSGDVVLVEDEPTAVSYTHLTLPTIYSV